MGLPVLMPASACVCPVCDRHGAALMLLLGILDILFVNHACHSIITRGASVQLVFGFEVWKQEQSQIYSGFSMTRYN